jgi:hypothetical protein
MVAAFLPKRGRSSMRNLTVVVVAATLVTSAFMGCGSSGTKVKLPGGGDVWDGG